MRMDTDMKYITSCLMMKEIYSGSFKFKELGCLFGGWELTLIRTVLLV